MAKTTITNALVFDGHSLHKDLIVTFENGFITNIGSSANTPNANIIDGTGQTLLPGLIDAHVHLGNDVKKAAHLLQQLVKAGVTTALDMGYLTGSTVESLRNHPGIADLRFVGNFATSTGSMHTRVLKTTKENLVDNPELAIRFVGNRAAEGADYIKIIADMPGPSQEVVNTLVVEARKHGKLTVAHASRNKAVAMAQEGNVDILTHVPMDFPLDAAVAKVMKDEGRVCVPTLTMMKTMARIGFLRGLNYAAAKESVVQLHKAGVPILAGTDSNSSLIARVKHGKSLHRELELLVDAGLSNEEALRAATSLPAEWFQMKDRGMIEVGRRADLVLVDGNPTENITTTRNMKRVWVAGNEVVL